MNELIIAGIVAAVFAAMCVIAAAVEHAGEVADWLEMELTAAHMARVAKQRVRAAWKGAAR